MWDLAPLVSLPQKQNRLLSDTRTNHLLLTFQSASTMNLPLTGSMRSHVDQRVSQEGYGTSNEYVRELIQRDKDRSQMRTRILKGLESPETGQADAAYFQGLRKRLEQRTKA